MGGRERGPAAWSRLTGSGAAASIGLALLAGVCVLICVAAPRASLDYRTRALHRVLGSLSAQDSSISGSAGFSDVSQALDHQLLAGDIVAARAELARHLNQLDVPLRPPAAGFAGLHTNLMVASRAARSAISGGLPPQVEILYRDQLTADSRLVDGRFPATAVRGRHNTVFQAAVTPATAARFSLRLGSRLTLTNGITLSVSGILRPVAPRSVFWSTDPTAATPLTITSGTSGRDAPPYWTGAAFIGAGELPDLQHQLPDQSQMTLDWSFPLRLGGLTADQATGLQQSLIAGLNQAGLLLKVTYLPVHVELSTGLVQSMGSFVGTDAAVGSLLALLWVSLAVIGAVVLLLGARLLTEHRDGELALLRARGAALWQLAWIALRGGAAAALPASLLAAGIAVAVTPGPDDPLGWLLAGLTVLVALAGPPLIAVSRHARRRVATRADAPPPRRDRARRLVAEATLICAAAGGLVILRLQGLPAPGSTSFFLSTAPVMVAIPAAIVVVRCYPVLLAWLLRITRRGRGITAYVGLARGTRTSLSAALPAFALVLALAVVAFGAMVRAAVVRGEVAASWQVTGADAAVGQPGSDQSLSLGAQQAIARVPGVRHTAGVLNADGTIGPIEIGGTPVEVVVLDPARYAAVTADMPGPRFPASALARPAGRRHGPVPVLTSPAVAAQLRHSGNLMSIGYQDIHIRVAGLFTSTQALAVPGPVIVFPQWAAGPDPLPPNLMLLAGPRLDKRALDQAVHRTAPAAVVTLRSDLLARLRSAPLPVAGYRAFAEGTVAAGGFSVLILLLTLVLGARSRDMTLARLATMGLSSRQARRLVIIETLPSVLAATAGGVGCAWALAPLLGPELDLSVFTGSTLSVPVRTDLIALAIAAGGLIVLTMVTLAVQATVASRRGAGRALRVGE